MVTFRKCFLLAGIVVLTAGVGVALAEEAAGAADAPDAGGEVADKDMQNKLLPLTQMENAFKKALMTRNKLAQYIALQEEELKKAEDDEQKKTIRKNIGTARKRLQTLNIAMEVIFGIGGRRVYNYDEVNSTIYLRVGTVEEVFIRAIRARDLYSKYIAEQKEALDKETDEAKKADIQKSIDTATRRYQLVAAALYHIYGVSPKRDYTYNPKNSTLYLKVSESELEKLKAEVEKLQKEKAEQNTEAGEN